MDHTMKVALAAAACVLAGAAAQAQSTSGAMSLPGYTQVFFHDFPGTSLDTGVWPVDYGGTSSNGYFQWDPTDISVNNGLTITFAEKNGTWTTGGIDMGSHASIGGQSNGTIYGLFEFYAKINTRKQGVGPVLLLWPCDNAWPPEIDVLEAPNGNNEAFQTLHWGASNTQISTPTSMDPTQWHDYAVDWEPGQIVFYIDGKVTATIPASNGNDPNQCMVMGISGYIANPGDSWYGSPPTDATPSSFTVAWVRVSKPASDPAFPPVASSSGSPTTVPLSDAQQTAADLGIPAPMPLAPVDPTSADLATATAQMQSDIAAAQGSGKQITVAELGSANTAAAANDAGGGAPIATAPSADTTANGSSAPPAAATGGNSTPSEAGGNSETSTAISGPSTGSNAADIAAAISATENDGQPTCIAGNVCGRGNTDWNQYLWTSPGYDTLVGGRGKDVFLVDAARSDPSVEIVGWHPGDTLVLPGYVAGSSRISWSAATDAQGDIGATARIVLKPGGPTLRIAFVGLDVATAQMMHATITSWYTEKTPQWNAGALPALR
jgi:beta-glucanase (GH16 family)